MTSASPVNLVAIQTSALGSAATISPSVLSLYRVIGQGVRMAFSNGDSSGAVGAGAVVAGAGTGAVGPTVGASPAGAVLHVMAPSSSTTGVSKESPAALNCRPKPALRRAIPTAAVCAHSRGDTVGLEELIEAAFHMEAYTPPRRSWMICGLESVVIDFISFQESGRAWWYTLSRLSVVLMLAG